ncbi:MAG: Replicative DNA helicase [Parcubacteria group bacterium ADurb.Bin216]|nr:MAG: Replicative DNA helicase [Parcubacteria group bacterium ADurb.Bin216]
MNSQDYTYVEIVRGRVSNRGKVIQLPESTRIYDLDYYGKEQVSPSYHSLFYQSKDYQDYRHPDGSRREYNGMVYCDYLLWDLDNQDMSKAHSDAIELVERMIAYNSNNIRVYFSGGKGFHIVYICPELTKVEGVVSYEQLVKNVCLELAVGISSHDKSRYAKTQLIRTPNSRHEGGLYKIPLTYEELKSKTIEQIQDLAKSQRKLTYTGIIRDDSDLLEIVKSNINKKAPEKLFEGSELIEGIANGFEQGNRNNGLFATASLLAGRGISGDLAYHLIQGVNHLSGNPLPEAEVRTIVSSASKYSPNDGVKQSVIEIKSSDIVTMEEAAELFVKMKNLSGNFSFGPRYELINKVVESTMLGDVIGLISDSGVGKSTLGMDFLNEAAKIHDDYGLFISLEMPSHSCFFRAATISAEPDELGKVNSSFVAADMINNKSSRSRVSKEWERVLLSDKKCDLNRIEAMCRLANEMYNGKVRYAIIDYGQNIDGASHIEIAQDLYRNIKEIFKRLNMYCIILLQTNKSIPNKYTEIEDTHVEGVKAIKQMCDFIIGVWKDREDKKRIHGKFLKTRWEENDDCKFDLVREGLKYHTEVYKPVNEMMGGL